MTTVLNGSLLYAAARASAVLTNGLRSSALRVKRGSRPRRDGKRHKVCVCACVRLTEGGQVSVLGAEQEEVHSDLLTGAVQSQLLIEVSGWSEVLDTLNTQRVDRLTHNPSVS